MKYATEYKCVGEFTYCGGITERNELYFETLPELQAARWISAPEYDGTVQNFNFSFNNSGKSNCYKLYICGLGFFNVLLNDKELDNLYYKPMLSDYGARSDSKNPYLKTNNGHHIFCYTYNLSDMKFGENHFNVLLAPGYYCNTDKVGSEPDFSFGKPKLFFEIYDDEGNVAAASGTTEVTVCGTNIRSSLYKGDFIDFRGNDKKPDNAVITNTPGGELTSPYSVEDKVISKIRPVSIKQENGKMILDFGANRSGCLLFKARGLRGDTLKVSYAEISDSDGALNFETGAWHGWDTKKNCNVSIYQQDSYILSGKEDEIVPLFSWHCFRYALLEFREGTEIIKPEFLFISADIKITGNFDCSVPVFNKLHDVFTRTLQSNLHCGVISDCPHREKLPYTGDGSVIMKSAWYIFDAEIFYRKWLDDIYDSQQYDGYIPNSAPYIGGGGGYAWSNALCTVSKNLYMLTGDAEVLKASYKPVLGLLEYYDTKHDGDYIIRRNGHEWMLGDWLAPEMVASNVYYISTVCYLSAVQTALEIAELFFPEDIKKLTSLKNTIRKAINEEFFDINALQYGNGVQGEDILALAFDLPDEETAQRLKIKIENHYRSNGYHIDTGIVLTSILLKTLCKIGLEDTAYKIMTCEDYPSYSYLTDNETTLAEHWSKKWPDYRIGNDNSRLVKGGGDLSHCHPMFGSTVAWLYENVAGLDLSGMYKNEISFAPLFIRQMNFATAKKETRYGITLVKWESDGKHLHICLKIPASLKVDCKIPWKDGSLNVMGNRSFNICSKNGIYQFALDGGTWEINSVEEVI